MCILASTNILLTQTASPLPGA